MAFVRILHHPDSGSEMTTCPVADATAVVYGDLVSYESNTATVMDGASDDATLLGFGTTSHVANERMPDNVVVGLKGVVVYGCTSAQHALGAGLLWTSANTLAADSGANTIAWSHKFMVAAGTQVDALFDIVALGKLFTVDA